MLELTHNHDTAPQNGDGRQELARSKLAHYDRRRWLTDNVWDEEDESDDTVAIDARCGECEVSGHSVSFFSIQATESQLGRLTRQYWRRSGWFCPSN